MSGLSRLVLFGLPSSTWYSSSTRVKYSKTFVQQFLLSITLPNPHPLSLSQHLHTSEPSCTLSESTSPHFGLLCINFHFRFVSICMLVTFGLVFERIFLTIKCTFEPSSQVKFPILKAAGLLLWQPIIRARKTTAKRAGLLRRLTDGMSCLLSSLSVVLQRTKFLCYHLLFVIPCPCQVMAFHC